MSQLESQTGGHGPGRSLEEFDQALAPLSVRGQWHYNKMLEKVIGGPPPKGDPMLWQWRTLYPRLLEACDVLPESFTARRALILENPGFNGPGATHTLLAGIQIVRPHEIAWAHRHSLAAVRFVIQGNGDGYTVVEGETCPMATYDLLLNPAWTWHDHHNPTDEPMIWLDTIDVPLMLSLNLQSYEPYPGNKTQPKKEKPPGARPEPEGPVLRYPWPDTEAQLKALAKEPGSPYDGIVMEYTNTLTGGRTLPSLTCWTQMLRPKEHTQRHRHNSSSVFFVVRGEGTTIVDGKELEWQKHDTFAVPNWAWHEHRNRSQDDEAILFSVNDLSLVETLGLYHEEPESSLAAVTPWAADKVRGSRPVPQGGRE